MGGGEGGLWCQQLFVSARLGASAGVYFASFCVCMASSSGWMMCEISGSRCLVVAWRQAVCPTCSPAGEAAVGNIPAAEAAEAAVGEAAVAEASEAAVWESGSGRGSEGNIPEVHGRVKRSGEMSRLSSQAKRRSSGQSKVPRIAWRSWQGWRLSVQVVCSSQLKRHPSFCRAGGRTTWISRWSWLSSHRIVPVPCWPQAHWV